MIKYPSRDYFHKKKDWQNFKFWRNKAKSLIRTSKKALFENAINENKNNSFLWKHVKNITAGTETNKMLFQWETKLPLTRKRLLMK